MKTAAPTRRRHTARANGPVQVWCPRTDRSATAAASGPRMRSPRSSTQDKREGDNVSGRLVSLVLDLPIKMDPSRKLVLVCLADHANERDGGLAWPSNATVSKRTGICERQVQEHRAALEPVSNSRGGRGKAKVYRLKLETILGWIAHVDAVKAAAHCRELRRIPGALPLGFALQNPAGSALNPAGSTPKPSSPVHERVRPTATEPEVEPESEPESEPARASAACNVTALLREGQHRLRKKLTSEPEGTQGHMTREEQIEAARKLAQQKP